MTFQALSVIQPWPWMILRPDVVGDEERRLCARKDVENRVWATNVRGWVLLHASKTKLAKWDYQAAEMFAAKRGVQVPLRDNLDYGAIVGAMRIDGCENCPRSQWFTGPWGFVIGAAVPFVHPVSCSGTLKFFPLPPKDTAHTLGGAELTFAIVQQIHAAGLAKAFSIPE